MKLSHLLEQVKSNIIAVFSLAIALVALSYTTWREDVTERNRTLRAAGFEVLKNLGELQLIINYIRYDSANPEANPYMGWGYIAIIGDMSALLPGPIEKQSQQLAVVWGENWQKLKTDDAAVEAVTKEVDKSREIIVAQIRELH